MANKRKTGTSADRRTRLDAVEAENDPDVCGRVGMHVALTLECKKWLDRSIELNYQGRLKEAVAATAKAGEVMERMLEILRTH